MDRTRTLIIHLFAFALLATGNRLTKASAGQAGGIRIHVIDSSGAAVPGVALHLTGRDTRQLTADREGSAAFSEMPAGVYHLNVSAEGFRATTRDLEVGGTTQDVTITLDPASLTTSITVSEPAYLVDEAVASNRLGLMPMDTPQQIDSINRRLIADRALVELKDVVTNAPGVYAGGSHGGEVNTYVLRGFADFNNVFRDGLRQRSTYYSAETADLERVEVLKGPAGSLYGLAEPGGIINLVTKEPLPETHGSIGMQLGNYDFHRPTLDISGPMNRARTLLYRFNGAYQNTGSFRDFQNDERRFLAPSLEWLSGKTQVIADFSYMKDQAPYDSGLPAFGNRPAPLAISFNVFGPGTLNSQRTTRGALRVSRPINDHLRVRSAFTAIDNGSVRNAGLNGVFDALSGLVARTYTNGVWSYRTYTSQNDLNADFATGILKHTLLAGGEFYHQDAPPYFSGALSIAPQSLRMPLYRNLPPYVPRAPVYTDRQNVGGFYFQDLIALTAKWKLLVGGRETIYRDTTTNGTPGSAGTRTENNVFSPRMGMLFQPRSNVTVYANWSRSLNPNTGVSLAGTPFAPQLGKQWEAGVKTELGHNNLSATAAFFDIRKQNVLTPDPVNPNFSIQTGEQGSKGAEISMSGQPLPGWNLLAGYAFTQATVLKDNRIPIGSALLNVPRHGANFWTTYQPKLHLLRKMFVGGGYFATSSRYADLPNTVLLPGYGRLDATIAYQFTRRERHTYRIAFNMTNALDRRYFEVGQTRNALYPGAPRILMGSVRYSF